MATLPNQPPLTPPPPPPPSSGRREPEIIVMPEKYFGMSLKMDSKTQAEMERPLPPPPPKPLTPPKPPVPGPLPRRPIWPFVLLAVVILLLVGGGFVWFNRDILFKATPIVQQPPTPVSVTPSAPTNLSASVASGTQATSLAWVDTANNETGFRIERKEGDSGTFVPVTNLPANSSNFLDISVQAGRSYDYRVVAIGQNAESGPSNTASVDIAEAAPPAPVVTLPPGGLDSDSDGLTDAEEPLYGTDLHNPDSDKDGFLDGNEVFHLYNPAAKAPINLVDSGLVTPTVSPAGWSLFVPKQWTATLDQADGSSATVRTNQGESFKIRIEDNATHQSLQDWYLAKHPDQAAGSLRTITTKGGLEGLLSPDRLEAYFSWDGKIFVLVYDIGTKSFINFRTTYEMMLNSLRLSGAPVLSEAAASSTLNGPGDFLPTATSTSASSTTSTTVAP